MLRAFAVAVVISSTFAGSARAQAFPPDGPNIPVIANTEDASGGPGQTIAAPPPPKAWDQELAGTCRSRVSTIPGVRSTSRSSSTRTVERILYLGNLTGNLLNPLTRKVEPNGTSIIDVTNVKHTKFLFHIPGPSGDVSNAGAQMVRVCGWGDVLPHGEKGKWELLRAFGNAGPDELHQIWDVTDPAAPKFITTVVSGLEYAQKLVGMRYRHRLPRGRQQIRRLAAVCLDSISRSTNSERPTASDLHPRLRPRRLEPGANIKAAQSCTAAPGPNCYEGTKNPPCGVHGPISTGTAVNARFALRRRQGCTLSTADRQKLLNGCKISDRFAALRG